MTPTPKPKGGAKGHKGTTPRRPARRGRSSQLAHPPLARAALVSSFSPLGLIALGGLATSVGAGSIALRLRRRRWSDSDAKGGRAMGSNTRLRRRLWWCVAAVALAIGMVAFIGTLPKSDPAMLVLSHRRQRRSCAPSAKTLSITRSRPVTLTIPVLGIHTVIGTLGLQPDHQVMVPTEHARRRVVRRRTDPRRGGLCRHPRLTSTRTSDPGRSST